MSADDILKQVCANQEKGMLKPCLHTNAWHRGILPSNIRPEYLRAVPAGECRHPGCRCRQFRASLPSKLAPLEDIEHPSPSTGTRPRHSR